MEIKLLLSKLEDKTKILFPNADKHTVKVSVEFGTLNKTRYVVFLMGHYINSSEKFDNLSIIEGSIDKIFQEINRNIDGMKKNETLAL